MLKSNIPSRHKRSHKTRKPPNIYQPSRIMAEKKVVPDENVPKVPDTPPPVTCDVPSEEGCTPHGFISPSSSFSSLVDLQQKSPDEVSLKSLGKSSKPKSTVGEIIHQLQERIVRLQLVEDFTQKPPFDDLHFVHQQTRYSYDNSIKRRLISKIVELGIVEVFCQVFKSVHTVEYLVPLDEEENVQENGQEGEDTIRFADEDDPPLTSSTVSYNKHTPSSSSSAKKSPISQSLRNFKTVVAIVWNCADKSPHLCDRLVKSGAAQMLLQDLTGKDLTVGELKDQNRLFIVKGYLTILSNVLFFHMDSREILREAGAVKILQPFLKSTWLMVKTKVLILMSYLVTENENDILNNSDKNINFMIKMLKIGIDSEKHFAKKYGYWAVEMAAGLNRFAVNDSNKEKIIKNGGLPLYVSLLQSSCSTEEQMIAAQGLWLLSFIPECRKKIMAEKGALEGLQQLEATSSREEIKRTVHGVLWMLREKASIYHLKYSKIETNHVHLCYHPSSKPLVVKLRERLKGNGYKIYMDVDNTGGGCNLDVMAESLARAAVVILCMSHMYRESPACRTEASYTQRIQKPFIGVRIQPSYVPDGWLAKLTGNTLCLDLSSEDKMDVSLGHLVRELGTRGQLPGATHHYEVHKPAAICNGIGNPVTRHAPETWKVKDVQQWLREHELSNVLDRFEGIDGSLLLEAKRMSERAPEAFYKTLSSELNLNFQTILKFTKALSSFEQKS